MKQKVLVWLLSVCMVLTMMPLPAFAGEVSADDSNAVAEVGGTYYDSLQEAIDAAESDAIVTVQKDVSLTEGLTVAADDKITLNLNGKTITGVPAEAKAYSVIANKGDLTISGSGSVLCDHKLPGSTGYAVNTITNSGTLVVDGPTIKNTSTASNQIGYAIDNNSGTADAVVTIKDGTVTASGSNYYDGIRQFCNSETNDNSVIINGGTVSSLWLQNPSDGADTKDTKDVNGSFTISGGTVNSVYLEPSAAFEAAITGGTIGSVSYFSESEGRNLTGFITGGTFTDTTKVPAECVKYGYAVGNDGSVNSLDPIEIGTKEELLAFAEEAKTGNNFSGKTIKLTADIDMEGAEWYPFNFAGTFDGQNHKISNLTYVPNADGRMGFFQSMGGTAKNLTIDGIKGDVPKGGCFGGFARYLGGNANNVHIKNVTVDAPDGINWCFGGFAAYIPESGYANNCSVQNLTLTAVDKNNYQPCIGGFVGSNRNGNTFNNCDVTNFKATVSEAYGTGLAGFCPHTQIGWYAPNFVDCDVTNIDFTVTGENADVAGFVTWPGAHTDATDCDVTGKIDVTGVTDSNCFAGGFFGNLGWNCDLGHMGHVVTNCTADVDIITKVATAGGFVGSATNSNNNSMYATFNNCSATGDIKSVAGGTADIGGFAGDADRGVYNDCTASGTVTNNGTGYAGQFIGAFYDVTPKYDGRYPAGTRDYLVDEATLADCVYAGESTGLEFIGSVAEDADVTVGKYVAEVGDTKYMDLQEAIEACTNGETVKLLTDITYGENDVHDAVGGATGFGQYPNPCIIDIGGTRDAEADVNTPSNVNAVLDLNGHTITNTADAFTFLIMDNAKLTFTDSSDDKSGKVINTTEAPVLWVVGTETLVTIEAGYYETVNDEGLIHVTHGGDLVITGGEFKTTADDASLLIVQNSKDRQNSKYFISGKATVTIKGGTFNGFDPNNIIDDSTDPYTAVDGIAPGAKITNNNGVYTIATESNKYYIYDADDLKEFRDKANAGNTFSGKTVYVMDNIDLGGETWTPINSFAGTFNGGNYTISNFKLVSADNTRTGFFRNLGQYPATVKNLKLDNIEGTAGNNQYFGILVGNGHTSILDNIHISNVKVTTAHKDAWVGGVYGYFNWTTATNCTITNLEIDATAGAKFIGGFSGNMDQDLTIDNVDIDGFKVTVNDTDNDCAVGGFTGQTQTGHRQPTFTNCDVKRIDITATGTVDVGGFIADPGAHTIANNCTTEGKIDATGVTSVNCNIGGFLADAGWNNNESNKGGHKLTNCTAKVDITTYIAPAGGFIGSAMNDNNRNMPIAFTNCVAEGDITCVEDGTAPIGGFAGDADRGTYSECTASGTITNNGGGYAGQFVGAVEKGLSITFEDCSYTGESTSLKFIGNTADGASITTKTSVAKIGEDKYFTLQAAINAAEDGDTITVINNIDLAKTDIETLDGSYGTYGVVEGKSVTIDLNGKTISGTYAGDKMLVGVFSTDNNGHLTLTGEGTVDVTTAEGSTVYSLIANYEEGCSITIESGTYKLDKAKDCLIYSGSSRPDDLTVKGGVQVNGGNFTLGNVGTGTNGMPWIFNVLGQNSRHALVTGGTYNADIDNQFWRHEVQLLEGYYVNNNGDGTWTVKSDAVACIYRMVSGYKYNIGYATVAEALADAKSGETVKMVSPSNEAIAFVPSDVTLDLNGNILTVQHVASFGDVIDTTGGSGVLKAGEKNIYLTADNAQLPIYDSNAEGYKFFKYEVINLGFKAQGETAVKLGVRIVFEEAEAYKVLSETNDPRIEIALDLTWTGMPDGETIHYIYKSTTIKTFGEAAYAQVAAGGELKKAMTVTINGVDKLSGGNTISSIASVKSNIGPYYEAAEKSYTVE